ncbi:MAG: homoserine dehydrogenase [Hyphomicrobiaceae bacterium]
MSKTLRLGIAGLGTVGTGLVKLLTAHGERLGNTLPTRPEIVAVSARDRGKDRGIDIEGLKWFDDARELAVAPEIDVFVELIGGDEGIAREAVAAALKAGKHVVTANKALLAKHGVELAELAETNGVELNFEAAVAGGIPVIKTLRESLAGNRVSRVYGILNGTCNYILTTMQEEGRPFAEVLKEAQEKGYAEADPTFDIGGFDTAHKLTLLTSLAFGTGVAFGEIDIEGIESITDADIAAADDLGYRIKLLGVAAETETGIEQRVHPAMVPKDSAIAEVSGVTNCVAIDADFVGTLLMVGPGAGANATASSVASDIVDIAIGGVMRPFRVPAAKLQPYKRATLSQHQGAYYIRLLVEDKPGVMAFVSKELADRGISLESVVQRRPRKDHQPAEPRQATPDAAQVVITTHETTEAAIRDALKAIAAGNRLKAKPQMIRIERL